MDFAKRLLITGSREITERALIDTETLVSIYLGSILVGDAEGIDERVIQTCDRYNVPCTVHGAFGKMRRKTKQGKNIPLAGNYWNRDKFMADKAEVVVAFWNGFSARTRYTFQQAILRGIPVVVRNYKTGVATYYLNGEIVKDGTLDELRLIF
jgi:hypothetical protein